MKMVFLQRNPSQSDLTHVLSYDQRPVGVASYLFLEDLPRGGTGTKGILCDNLIRLFLSTAALK